MAGFEVHYGHHAGRVGYHVYERVMVELSARDLVHAHARRCLHSRLGAVVVLERDHRRVDAQDVPVLQLAHPLAHAQSRFAEMDVHHLGTPGVDDGFADGLGQGRVDLLA